MQRIKGKSFLITTKEAAAILGVSPATVRNWTKTGLLAGIQGRKGKFSTAEVERLREEIAKGQVLRLTRRANKARLSTCSIPSEYLSVTSSRVRVRAIAEYIHTRHIPSETALFLLALHVLSEKGELTGLSSAQLPTVDLSVRRQCVRKEIESWRATVNLLPEEGLYDFLLVCPLPAERDALGVLYQSIRTEGAKSRNGAYYTPQEVVHGMVREVVQPFHTALDPCCGTGQFLLEIAEVVDDPRQIYGFDIDETAVRIARLNVLLCFPAQEFEPNVWVRNALFDAHTDVQSRFDVIASNPPWGYHFTTSELKKIVQRYPLGGTSESFSLFLKVSLELLKEGGMLSFILPESVLNVQSHKTARQLILEETILRKITCLGTIFKRIFTPVVRLDLEKRKVVPEYQVPVLLPDGAAHRCEVAGWNAGPDCIFNVHCEELAASILGKVYLPAHTTLSGQADWALGLVTGNNRKFVAASPTEDMLPVWRGKDITPFRMGLPSGFLRFEPEKWQQVAPLNRYHAPEKLVYRFISKRLVVAYDNEQRLTLNSANVLIPRVPDYPVKLILALFNSSLYQFLYQKKFSSMKVLRGHLEALPLPWVGAEKAQAILNEADRILQGENIELKHLDALVFSLFPLTQDEVDYVVKNIE